MIEIAHVSAGYDGKTVLQDISAAAKAGQFIALLGPNGSGKSTLLKTMCGLLPAKGSIKIEDRDIRGLSARQRAKTTAYLAQSRETAPGLSVLDILEIGRAPYRGRLGSISPAGQAAIKSAAEKTNITAFLDHKFAHLSGGEQARVLLARALVTDAPILLADEPIASLDPLYQITTMETLKAETRRGVCVIAALHDLALARQFADIIWVMQSGRLVKCAPADTALDKEILSEVFGLKTEHMQYLAY